MRSKLMATVLAALTLPALAVTFTVDSVKQRYPWNGLVDLDYTVTYGPDEAELDPKTNRLEVVVRDMGTDPAQTVLLTGFDTFPLPLAAGTHHVVWNAQKDGVTAVSDDIQVQFALIKTPSAPKYMVIDLSAGWSAARYPVTYLDAEPAGGFNTDEYKTDKIAFRLVYPGHFVMGAPATEPGCEAARERPHPVLLTKPFYLAIFELTLGQFRRLTGQQPSGHYSMDERQPLNNVPMEKLRGKNVAAPAEFSPLAVLRAKTRLAIDLPTEAQWEYACRAGTTTPFNDGVACAALADLDVRMSALGRFSKNVDDPRGMFTTLVGNYAAQAGVVGGYPPNPWGFYDMHGNVTEFVRDRWTDDPGAVGPVADPCLGDSAGTRVVGKGGSFSGVASRCRSGARSDFDYTVLYNYAGCRLALTLED